EEKARTLGFEVIVPLYQTLLAHLNSGYSILLLKMSN
ncbi:hypothetical protein SOVF_120200, partial [Spinacia oleracea]